MAGEGQSLINQAQLPHRPLGREGTGIRVQFPEEWCGQRAHHRHKGCTALGQSPPVSRKGRREWAALCRPPHWPATLLKDQALPSPNLLCHVSIQRMTGSKPSPEIMRKNNISRPLLKILRRPFECQTAVSKP